MADRDIKLNKAREKLDKFRNKKKMQEDPEKQDSSPVPSSSTSSPIMFTVKTDRTDADNEIQIAEGMSMINYKWFL